MPEPSPKPPNSESAVMISTSQRASTGKTPQMKIRSRGQKYANPRNIP